MSKGSARRPIQIPRSEFEENWDAIFGKKDKKPEGPKKQA